MADDDYEVGYGKPPKHTRFTEGQSGNPRGRPAGARGFKAVLERELKTKHAIQINKMVVKGSKMELLVKTIATRAAAGDLKAAQILLPIIVNVLGVDDRNAGKRQLSPLDQQILSDLLGGRLISGEPIRDEEPDQ